MCDFRHDLFVSYSHYDKDWVRHWLLPRLEAAGLRVLIDYRDFEIGVPSLVNMENAVAHSRKTVVVLTPEWVTSEWTTFESLLIQTKDPAGCKARMLPLRLKPCNPPDRIAMLTCADFTKQDEWETQLARLIASVQPGSAPLPSMPPRVWTIVTFGTKWDVLAQSLYKHYQHAPEYPELCRLVRTVQERLGRTYRESERFYETEDWQNGMLAIKWLASFGAQSPELQGLVKKIRLELARMLVEAAKRFRSMERWSETFLLSTQARILHEDNSEAIQIAEESKRALGREQREKEQLYIVAKERCQRGEWEEAADLLVQVHRIDPDYMDTKTLLEICNHQRRKEA